VQLRETENASRGRRAHGYTLIELVIVMALLGVVTAVLFNALWNVQRSETYTRRRTVALNDMRTTMNRLTKDLRQVSDVNGTATGSHLDVDTYVDGVSANVVYDVIGGALTRRLNGGPAKTLQRDITTSTVFTYTPDVEAPDDVTIDLFVRPANVSTTLQLHSEIELRNR
jgi:prepilin-type N-terminal cleavage/methylation domain-containing protein